MYSYSQTQEIQRLNGIYKRLLTNSGVTMIEGEGKVAGPHEVEVTQLDGSVQKYTAKNILIATGSRAQRVKIPGEVYFDPSLFIFLFSVWPLQNLKNIACTPAN